MNKSPIALIERIAMIDMYKQGYSLRDVARHHGVRMQAVHHVIKTYAPDAMRAPYEHQPRRKVSLKHATKV